MPSNSRVDRLKQMLTLEQRRAALQDEMDSLGRQLTQLSIQLYSDSAPTSTAAPAAQPRTTVSARPAKRSKRGHLKAQILDALRAAGAAGVKVKELAQSIGTKPVNVHSWFHSALKTDKTITKIKGGHYRLKSAPAGGAAAAAPAPTPVASKPRGGKRKPSKRGQVSANILAALKAAGSSGITVSDLSKKLGSSYKNVYIWFATTGKKQPGLKKIAPATYSLAS